MRTLLLLSFWLYCALFVAAQTPTSPLPTVVSTISPEMAASLSAYAGALATGSPSYGGNAGDANSDSSGSSAANAAGASGSDNESFSLSKGGMVAIIVVVALVAIFGIGSTILFYIAKKRSWEIRASIRRSAKKVVTALTPRRSEFPRDVKSPRRSSKGLTKIDDVPPTPRIKISDIEKGNSKVASVEVAGARNASSKWGRKTDR